MENMSLFEYVNCNLCDADDTELVFIATDNQFHLDGRFNVVRCKRCGLIYVNPRPTQKETKFYYPKERYYSCQESCERKGFDQRMKSLIRQSLPGYNEKISIMSWVIGRAIGTILQRQIDIVVPFKKDGKILDAGCGNGDMIGWMKEYGWETYGVDISREACEQAKKQGLDVFCGELQDAHFSSDFFDVITVNHVLEHVHNPLALLKECNRILKKDGLLIVDCPNFGCFDSRLFGESWQQVDVPRHLYHFTWDTLNKTLNVAGFEVSKWKFKLPLPLCDRVSIKLYKENNESISSKHLLRRLILKGSLFKLIKYFFSKDRGPRFSVNLTAYASKPL